jgi:hypothetical protein
MKKIDSQDPYSKKQSLKEGNCGYWWEVLIQWASFLIVVCAADKVLTLL